MHQERPQVTITSLRDTGETLSFSTGMLPGNKPKPSCELPPVVERTAIGDCCDHGCSRDRADPFHRADALTKRVLLERLVEFRLYHQNALIQRTQLFIESCE